MFARAKERGKTRVAKTEGFFGAVSNSAELSRILQLPRRELDLESVFDLSPVFVREGGEMELRPIQSAALLEAHFAGGLFAPIGVGFGKTLIMLLLAEAMDCERAVLLVPPQLRAQLEYEIEEVYGPHFDLPLKRITRIVAYSELSLAKNTDLLERLAPDLLVGDEAHKLRRRQSVRTKRVLRYLEEHPECRCAFLSGTMTTRSIMDYAHLIELALRKGSPLPKGYYEIQDWAGALDVKPSRPMDPGALAKLCRPGESVRSGFRRRLVETPGVVATEKGALGTALYVRPITVEVPPPGRLLEALSEARNRWSFEEEEFSSALERARFLCQLVMGFYYRWIWPDGSPDIEWLEARRSWHRAVREKLKRAQAGLDSELLLANAAERWRKKAEEGISPKSESARLWECPEWVEWKKVKGRYRPTPPTETVWLSDYIIQDVVRRGHEVLSRNRRPIVWCQHRALQERLAQESGWPSYGAGDDATKATAPIIICSTHNQKEGKNLQDRYDYNIITSIQPNGEVCEQVLGRTHRPGQRADDVWADYYAHSLELQEAMDQVIADASYIQETTGQIQKILYATKLREKKKS